MRDMRESVRVWWGLRRGLERCERRRRVGMEVDMVDWEGLCEAGLRRKVIED